MSVSHVLLNGFPFSESDEADYVAQKSGQSSAIETGLKKNEYDSSVTDTVKTIKVGRSSLQVLSNIYTKAMLMDINVMDNNIVLKNNTRIGDGIEKVFAVFGVKYEGHKEYKFLELLPEMGATTTLTFYFENKILTRINYCPYTG